ncbi:MAG: hypothetical protein JRM78_01690 [Nitrososphaerota archaeon]|nr:hypothetical protein [Nitrososphaerota archaeon]
MYRYEYSPVEIVEMILGALFLFGLPLLVIAYSYFTYYQPSLAATVVAEVKERT